MIVFKVESRLSGYLADVERMRLLFLIKGNERAILSYFKRLDVSLAYGVRCSKRSYSLSLTLTNVGSFTR